MKKLTSKYNFSFCLLVTVNGWKINRVSFWVWVSQNLTLIFHVFIFYFLRKCMFCWPKKKCMFLIAKVSPLFATAFGSMLTMNWIYSFHTMNIFIFIYHVPIWYSRVFSFCVYLSFSVRSIFYIFHIKLNW